MHRLEAIGSIMKFLAICLSYLFFKDGDFMLKILSLSPTAIKVQWNCTQVKPITLAWRGGLVKNALEQWQRTDMKVFDWCQNDNNIGQQVSTMISDLEEGMQYSLSVTEEFIPIHEFKTLTSGQHK